MITKRGEPEGKEGMEEWGGDSPSARKNGMINFTTLHPQRRKTFRKKRIKFKSRLTKTVECNKNTSDLFWIVEGKTRDLFAIKFLSKTTRQESCLDVGSHDFQIM